jgi:hypothetical protein
VEIIKTTGNRGLDEEIERILARINTLEKPVKFVKTPDTTGNSTVTSLPPILSIIGASTVQPVQATGVVGILSSYAPEDHAHAGVHSVKVITQAQMLGDVVYQAGTGMTLVQSGNTITFNAIFGTIGPVVVVPGASPYTVGGGDITILADTTTGPITIKLGGGAINTGRFVWIKNSGTGANLVTVTATSGSVLSVTSLPAKAAALYQSDGSNWNTLMNSTNN